MNIYRQADKSTVLPMNISLTNIQSQKRLFEKHTIAKRIKKEKSDSNTCDQEIYRLATLDYGQRWLVLNPILNNKHKVMKIHMLHDYTM